MLNKENIIYARVSTLKQNNDFLPLGSPHDDIFTRGERQIKYLQKKYPNHKLISYIGSVINLNRRGLRKIIDMAIIGKLNEVVVVHKDRLCRFDYELIPSKIINLQVLAIPLRWRRRFNI